MIFFGLKEGEVAVGEFFYCPFSGWRNLG
jgi:hypothetical protein